MSYSWSLPIGDTKDFTDNDSWFGFSLEGRRFLRENQSVGLFFGWTEFYQRTNDALNFPSATVTGGAQYRHILMLPMMANAHYYFGQPGRPRPYVGLNVGAYYLRQLLDIGLSEFTTDEFVFGLAPEVGIGIPVRYGAALVLNARYHLPAKGSSFLGGDKSLQSLSIGIGMAYSR